MKEPTLKDIDRAFKALEYIEQICSFFDLYDNDERFTDRVIEIIATWNCLYRDKEG